MNLRNHFLGTSGFLFSPPGDPPAGGDDEPKPTVLNEDVGAEDDGTPGEGPEAGVDDESGEESEASADDDDPDLADLPPEVKAKVKGVIQKKIERETGWRDRQINKLNARKRAAEEDVRALETIADPARRTASAARTAAGTENLTPAQIETRAKELAQQMTAQDRYDNAANDADAKGKVVYGDSWGKILAQLPKLGGIDVADMVDILATDQPHVVLYTLADPEEYERVMALPPARRRNEYVKLSLKEAPKSRGAAATEDRTPSRATPPVSPVGNGRRVAAHKTNLYDDKAPDDAWYETRNAERRKKFNRAE